MKLKYFQNDFVIDIKAVLIVAVLAVISIAAALIEMTGDSGEIVVKTSKLPKNLPVIDEKITSATPSCQVVKSPEPVIRVYVAGCVKQSGVVKLKKGSIIEDAIKAAGGATSEADLENINLAYELSDNDMVRIPSRKKMLLPAAPVSEVNEGGTGRNFTEPVIKDSGGAVPGVSGQNGQHTLININTATVEELDTLPGIGIETAKDIIEYRGKNGGFKVITDIMKVPGIKESRFSKIKDKICVE